MTFCLDIKKKPRVITVKLIISLDRDCSDLGLGLGLGLDFCGLGLGLALVTCLWPWPWPWPWPALCGLVNIPGNVAMLGLP